ncbi:MAG: gamma-glutamylcyclotransferase [Gemmatimonadetes bacterium]|nr:gamma-glutamylcyclotransferase [Gemmatimonadota bacterium]NIQ52849.1 gamma-glutamylcyclotransferase [Gemmatimonadota bacterium]NIU72979.1 gamma-glutamylcyclotransferase [Gammaproteobacteria bacterium]NIX43334.1 gamma-glutamylcyclotransferase [Gemmatimonadota bacterium]NIY11351.1 gamma-glutamylcyclotransferase [Gemmatimonadota bacterium]
MHDAFHLFTYGSLRSGAAPARSLLRPCHRVGDGVVRGTLYDVGEYPALLLSGDDAVRGEIWRCPAGRLRELDRYEGVAEGLFRRAAVVVDGLACWVYVAGPRLGPRLVPEARVG